MRVRRALLAFSRQSPCGGRAAHRAVKKRYEAMPPPTRSVMAAVRVSQARQASRRDDVVRRAWHVPSPGRLRRAGTVSSSVSRFTKVLPLGSSQRASQVALSGEGGYRRIARRKRSRLPRDEGTCAACGSESREEPGTHTLFPAREPQDHLAASVAVGYALRDAGRAVDDEESHTRARIGCVSRINRRGSRRGGRTRSRV